MFLQTKLVHIALLFFLLNAIIVTPIEVKEDPEEDATDAKEFDHDSETTHININASLTSPPEVQVQEMTRITVPINYYRESTAPADDQHNYTTSASTPSSVINSSTFNPSPQVFEYNTYPVLPAYPEAKHVHSERFNNLRPYSPPAPVPVTYSTPRTSEYLPPKTPTGSAVTKPYSGGVGTWFSSVGKPETRNPILVKEQPPYPFHFGGAGHTGGFGSARPGAPHSGYLPVSGHKEHGPHEISPWKKVIHFITTLLPIGLFLTALTPTVLTVMPGNVNNESVNLKSTRLLDVDNTLIDLLEGRADDTSGCHQTRLLCEAAVKGREPSATNLQKSLWLIASQSYEETTGPKEFLKLFYAIKGNKCKELKCDNKLKT